MVKINPVILVCAGLVLSVCFYYALIPMISTGKPTQNSQPTSYPSYDAPFGKLILATNLSGAPQNVTLYRVTPQDSDMIDYFNRDPVNTVGNLTSETEASGHCQKNPG